MAQTKISALIHTCDNAGSLGRALDSLRPCDEVIIVDHGSRDETVKVAKEHGAKVINAVPGVSTGAYAQNTRHCWNGATPSRTRTRWALTWPSASRTARDGNLLMRRCASPIANRSTGLETYRPRILNYRRWRDIFCGCRMNTEEIR